MIRKRFKQKVYYASILIGLLLGTGTLFYVHAEGWSYIDSFYFSIMTLTTIGFGDIVPITDMGKLFTSFYAMFGIGVMLYILISIIGVFIFRQEKFFDKIFFPEKNMRKQQKEIEEQEKDIEHQEKEIEEQEKEIEKHEKEIEKQEKEIEKIEKEIKKVEKKK